MVQGDLHAEEPLGWFGRGHFDPSRFQVYIDYLTKLEGARSASIVSLEGASRDVGGLIQRFYAETYRGQRIRFSCWLKTNRVSNAAGISMQIDSESTEKIAFDDIEDRPVSGTTNWTQRSIVLDVADTARLVTLTLWLHGPGQVWFDGAAFGVVGDDIPVTDQFPLGFNRWVDIPDRLESEPVDLGFEEIEGIRWTR